MSLSDKMFLDNRHKDNHRFSYGHHDVKEAIQNTQKKLKDELIDNLAIGVEPNLWDEQVKIISTTVDKVFKEEFGSLAL